MKGSCSSSWVSMRYGYELQRQQDGCAGQAIQQHGIAAGEAIPLSASAGASQKGLSLPEKP